MWEKEKDAPLVSLVTRLEAVTSSDGRDVSAIEDVFQHPFSGIIFGQCAPLACGLDCRADLGNTHCAAWVEEGTNVLKDLVGHVAKVGQDLVRIVLVRDMAVSQGGHRRSTVMTMRVCGHGSRGRDGGSRSVGETSRKQGRVGRLTVDTFACRIAVADLVVRGQERQARMRVAVTGVHAGLVCSASVCAIRVPFTNGQQGADRGGRVGSSQDFSDQVPAALVVLYMVLLLVVKNLLVGWQPQENNPRQDQDSTCGRIDSLLPNVIPGERVLEGVIECLSVLRVVI